MATFLRPGERQASAFGVSFDVDREAGTGAVPVPVYVSRERESASITNQRRSLPIYAHRTHILYLVEHHATTIIVGETGSGKTTQIPQYLYEAGWTGPPRTESGLQTQMVACTQPRRVAAMTVAKRVSEEMGCILGQEVGYSIRFEDVSTPGVTRIKFCTDGVLLREMMDDPLLSKYAVVMVDEAHERSLTTDVLLGLLKKVQRRRPTLRIIVSSATIQAQEIADFFKMNTSKPLPNLPAVRHSGGHLEQETLGGKALEINTDQCLLNTTPAILSVEGRTHAVQIHYLKEPTADYVRAAVEAVVAIHEEDLPGDILVFLTGQEECERASSWLREEERKLAAAWAASPAARYAAMHGGSKRRRLAPCTLYAGLPATAQLAALEPPARGARKVVVATNIAETSVTIEGVVYVIDCMFAKQRCYDPITGMESLLVAPISRASAAQRAGRAGRVRPGHAFRLCTEADYLDKLRDQEVPEMQRAELASVILQLKSLGIDNMMRFHWAAPPPAEAVVRGLETLHALGALGSDARLTHPLGVRMSELPLEPQLGRMLITGAEDGCAVEVATIVAMLGVKSVWASTGDLKALNAAKARFAVGEGDLVTYLNVWRGWVESHRSKQWAVTNYVSHRSMLRVADVKSQLEAHLRRLGLPIRSVLLETNRSASISEKEETTPVQRVQRALTMGLFQNAARLSDEITVDLKNAEDAGEGVYRLVRGGAGTPSAAVRLRVHPSSVLFRCRPAWVCFVRAQQTDTGWYEMQDILAIDPDWLPELAPHYFTQVPINPDMRP